MAPGASYFFPTPVPAACGSCLYASLNDRLVAWERLEARCWRGNRSDYEEEIKVVAAALVVKGLFWWYTWQNRGNVPGKGEVKEGGAYIWQCVDIFWTQVTIHDSTLGKSYKSRWKTYKTFWVCGKEGSREYSQNALFYFTFTKQNKKL